MRVLLIAAVGAVAVPSLALAQEPDAGAGVVHPWAPVGCTQQIVSSGDETALSLSEDASGLVLHFSERATSIGPTFPMSAKKSGRTIEVTIATKAKGNKSMPAVGFRRGEVTLPKDLSGQYTLNITRGKQKVSYTLEVADDVRVTARKVAKDSTLLFPSELWHRTPKDLAFLSCSFDAACGGEPCRLWFASEEVTRLPKLEDGHYLSLAATDQSCLVHADADALARLKASAARVSQETCAKATVNAGR